MITFKIFLLVLLSLVSKISGQDGVTVEEIDVIGDKNTKALNIDTPVNGKFVSCQLKWPNGTLTTDLEKTNLEDISYTKDCKFAPKKAWTVERSGGYLVTLTYKTENSVDGKDQQISKLFNINWIQPSSPESTKIFSDETLTLQVRRPNENIAEINKCDYVKIPSDEKSSPGKIVDGSCQVILNSVQASNDGLYKVLAITKKNHRLKAFAQVSVIDKKELEKNNEISVYLSSYNKIIRSDVPIVKTLYCILTDNKETIVSARGGPCEHNIMELKKSQEGEWKAKLLLEGRIEPFEQKIKVTVLEDKTLETICKNSEGGVDMLCKCPNPSSSEQICLFIGPSGQMISATEGVGNNKYAFYSDFDKSTNRQQCGLTIKSRDETDEGTWKCNVGTACSRVVEITKDKGCIGTDTNTVYTPTAPEIVYALNNTNIQGLTCSINADIEYCFFRTILGEEIGGNIYRENQGLCSLANEFKVYTNHTGNWTCNLGVKSQQKEYRKDINVQVLTSLFQPTQTEFVFKDKNVELKCLNHDLVKKEVSLCRFVRPDGKVIKLDSDATLDHYTSTNKLSQGICGLKLSSRETGDSGKWRCSALVSTDEKKEWMYRSFMVSSAMITDMSIRLIALVFLFHTLYNW